VAGGAFAVDADVAVEDARALGQLSRWAAARAHERVDPTRSLRQQRIVRLVALAVCLGLAAWAGVRAIRGLIWPDLAAHAPWHTSSAHELSTTSGVGFTPYPSGTWFFHTADTDDSPWIDFDLGGPHKIHEVEIRNLSNCCQERAIPLLVEVSSDGTGYAAVAERREVFMDTWDATFAPTVATHVRLRRLGKGYFHLQSVAIR
jgi:hypothetical protein